MSVSVMIVDDDDLMRSGLHAILASDERIEIVAEAPDGRRALMRARESRPDVVLMDVRMPDMDGISATRGLQELPTPPRVLVLTTFGHDEYVFGALRAGASGFLLKRATPEELIAAVHATAAGETPLAKEIIRTVVAHVAGSPRTGEPGAEFSELTPREREVLQLLARGKTNAEIATVMVIEPSTVKTHVKAILAKLGLRDRVQAVIYAYESGLVVPGA